MKNSYSRLLFSGMLVLFFASCEKSLEATEPLSGLKTTASAEQVYPLVGTDLSNNILPKAKLPRAILTRGFRYPEAKFKLIDTICEEYLSGTKLLDFNYLKEGIFTSEIKNDEITITTDPEFGSDEGFVKLNSGTKGWWTHWNYSPYTQYEYPNVLLTDGQGDYNVRELYMSFNKDLTALGFEIAPNIVGKDLKVQVEYMSWTYRDPALVYIEQTVSSPSGARLIAMKSEIPFNYVIIRIEDGAFAISNIRYALDR